MHIRIYCWTNELYKWLSHGIIHTNNCILLRWWCSWGVDESSMPNLLRNIYKMSFTLGCVYLAHIPCLWQHIFENLKLYVLRLFVQHRILWTIPMHGRWCGWDWSCGLVPWAHNTRSRAFRVTWLHWRWWLALMTMKTNYFIYLLSYNVYLVEENGILISFHCIKKHKCN